MSAILSPVNQANRVVNFCNHSIPSMESSSYTLLYDFYVACTSSGASKKRSLETACYVCKRSGARARLHACLSCVFIGCLRDHFEKHNDKHKFAMDLMFGAIYCFTCKDYKCSPSGRIKDFIPWVPSEEERELFKTHKPAKINQSRVGLRGLYNLGLTCYINCIIQVFANTPMMRNYFLSGTHSCFREKNCQACLLSVIFQELYSGKDDPLPLPELVYYLWSSSTVFRGHQGNDAQEFYQFYLSDLHNDCIKDSDHMVEKWEKPIQNHNEDSVASEEKIEKTQDSKPCRCVIHQIFSGRYQNRTICTNKCGTLSSTDLELWNLTYHIDSDVKLTDCIEKYIRGAESTKTNNNQSQICHEKCPNCEKGIKIDQVLFKVLPNILCFHFLDKTVENLKILQKTEKKFKVLFPKYLDMSFYLDISDTVKSDVLNLNGTHNQGMHSFKRYQSGKNMYILYAIVCHKGSALTGHYYSYIRKGEDIWYRFSDDEIEQVSFQEEVSKCIGTLFFYIKEILEYEQ